MTLQQISTEELQRELRRRRECVDCRRDKPYYAEARGWQLIEPNRTRCPYCIIDRELHEPGLDFSGSEIRK